MASERNRRVFCILALTLAVCLGADAAGLLGKVPFLRRFSSKNRVDVLIVVGNYLEPRLLAELVQDKTKQPLLVVSPEADGSTKLFFMPWDPPAHELPGSKYVEFVTVLNPKQVVFVGDEAYMPSEYVEQLRGRFPIVTVASGDWHKDAKAMAEMFDCKKVPQVYAESLLKIMEATANRPSGSNTPAAPGGVGEPTALPRVVVPNR